MPYFLYKVFPGKKFELIEPYQAYREAREAARKRRAEMTGNEPYQVKVMFAKDPEQAERLMSEEREPRPLGEDA
jgi:hypothetical protein